MRHEHRKAPDAQEVMRAPHFFRVASGDYETADGRFKLYRLVDIYPPAWNVEEVTPDGFPTIVDGAATKRDALALFTRWFEKS